MGNNNIVRYLDEQRTYTRKELYTVFRDAAEGYSYNRFSWDLGLLLSAGKIHRIGRNAYRAGPSAKKIYQPRYSAKLMQTAEFMEREYADAEYSLFETVMLNEFLNHQIANNTLYISAEKDFSEFVFRSIQGNIPGMVLYRPGKDDLRKYWEPGCIIIIDRISEAPQGINHYDTPLEKMFVDILADPSLLYMYSKSEYAEMLRTANDKYHIDYRKMLRYAGRRGKRTEIKALIEERGIGSDHT
ncbi:MAG: hypothetical protein K6G61_03085 [Solobacterium sp.]|nr:hypothetical protein [Solobacterium sp.]